ncbi:MAG: SDR family oxidoreductase [candidate division Zixibacteria bacterium]|nr:SDR family oxidoreductase [candidate division Zixibacteria bacterium]
MSQIASFLSGKTLLITGTTGFLAKGVVEKIMRRTPDVGRIYLLIRNKRQKDGSVIAAPERVETEVLQSSAFSRLRGIYGDRFREVMREKIVAVAGDLTLDRLGIEPEDYARLTDEVQIVVNSAASVTFDEEIDAALQLNTLGARRILEFASACRDAILIHVSTAYVNGQRTGRIPETPPIPNRSMAHEIGTDTAPFDVAREIDVMLSDAAQIHEASFSLEQREVFKKMALRQNARPAQRWLDAQMETFRKRWLKERLIEEGMRIGKRWGWHDSYTLTKAMGEQLIVSHRGELPVGIIRPSIVESSLSDPDPGWVEGLKVADPLIDAISRGRLPDFPARPDFKLDIIPVDIVVNTILSAMPRVAHDRGVQVFQVATGDRNPVAFHTVFDLVYDYFRKTPRLNKRGEPIAVSRWTYPTLNQFRRRYTLRYIFPLDVALRALDHFRWLPSANRWKQRATVVRSAISRMLYYATIYSPYTSLNCTFETTRTDELHNNLCEEDRVTFNCDVTRVRWPEYIQEIHIPGLKRHVLKTEAPDRETSEDEEVAERSGFEKQKEEPISSIDTINDIAEGDADANGSGRTET